MIESGSLKDFKLFDLLTILSQSKKSGQLVLNLRESTGYIYLFEGKVIDSEYSLLSGEEAFYELVFYESGDFRFIDDDTSHVEKNISKTNEELFQEGTLRLELTNSLKKYSITTELNSIIVIKSKKENDLLVKLIESGYDKIITLVQESKLSSNDFAQHISELLKDNYIEIEKNIQSDLWVAFQRTVNTLYIEFTSISGIKMTKDLENKIQDLILTNSLNLEFKDGKIDTKDLFKLTSNEQLSIYRLFLGDLKRYVSKIYGEDFIGNVFSKIPDVESKTIDLLNEV